MDHSQSPLGRHLPSPFGLYDPAFEHDACGTGFVARVDGRRSHEVLALGLEALENLAHRGAVGADAHSGDGAGVLAQVPWGLFAEQLAGRDPDEAAVAMGFWPVEREARLAAMALAEAAVADEGLEVLCWRDVPVCPEVLGGRARTARPHIAQLFVARGCAAEFELALYAARKRLEAAALAAGLADVYVASFSARTIVYKALASAHQLAGFYPDLVDERFETAICVFHQRYSTNTFPSWPLAQPFRLIGHNGEINTLAGNLAALAAHGDDLGAGWNRTARPWLFPVVQRGGSDSSALDNVLELKAIASGDPLHSLRLLVPPAGVDGTPFYDYHAPIQEPWDGPAALVASDGQVVAAALDRNGLRPARYVITADGLVVLGSEAGLVELGGRPLLAQGRLAPGRMLAVDTRAGEVLHDADLLARFASGVRPERVAARTLAAPAEGPLAVLSVPAELARLQLAHGFAKEDVVQLIGAMAATGKEPLGSMGDDTPLAALSQKARPLHHYFKQRFAQVTNPPIDPLRERLAFNLRTYLGARGPWLAPDDARHPLVALAGPILMDAELAWLRGPEAKAWLGQGALATLDALWDPREGASGLDSALAQLGELAVGAVRAGVAVLVIADRCVPAPAQAPLPSLLALAAVERALAAEHLLDRVSLVCEAGDVRDDHHVALLLGHGAAAVNPYLAFATAAGLAAEGQTGGVEPATAVMNVKAALELGLVKIMAKMGVCALASYRGARLFEAVGLGRALTDRYFPLTTARLGGVELVQLAREWQELHTRALDPAPLAESGIYRYRVGGEHHQYEPPVFKAVHTVGKSGKPEDFATLAELVANRPRSAVRDLLGLAEATPVPLAEVEPAEAIAKRFVASAMSLGALSAEAHACVAIALNRLGARSNSGEGGEDPIRARPLPNGDSSGSKIKQVAAGRFGVTPAYLASAEVLEIKMAQGAKPGEGGQLPGPKVTPEIARLRYATPGVPLISPPPHHDIYSIEDLAQLIHDLREVNPRAAIAVKLVSEAGVGTVAAGVAKAQADVLHLSGHDGGTGASPLGSIKHAGLPWELGLAETQQVLALNGLRGRVRLRVDGGLKTGRDVVVAALLGADEFGFGTALVVAAGCVMARQCHQNNCPVGIATQEPALRARFKGDPARIVSYLLALAEDVRGLLASLGLRSLEEAVGRVDLLVQRVPPAKAAGLDLSPLLAAAGDRTCAGLRRYSEAPPRRRPVAPDDEVLRALPGLPADGRFAGTAVLRNTQRAVGARLAGAIAARHGDHGFTGSIHLDFTGSAGQSFGAFCLDGLALSLVGVANDYVGKGMAGGRIVLRPGAGAPADAVLLGNTTLYGATGGALFASGLAGERFAVRNSGAVAVVEGVGDHGCEYMTRGQVVVLGPCGRNFAAGMTGGVAYVLDEAGTFEAGLNADTVLVGPLGEQDEAAVKALLQAHVAYTDSARASAILAGWGVSRKLFVAVRGAAAAAKVHALPERQAEGTLPEAL